jgi:hypothetical protein
MNCNAGYVVASLGLKGGPAAIKARTHVKG